MASDALFQRYLRLLGVEPRRADLDLLSALTAAHLARVPFENISKVLYFHHEGLVGVVPLERYLDGIEFYHFGGTCYANASHFNELLVNLGFDARLCGADMANPDVHLVNMVSVDGREYLVDVGYGAPLWTPLPRDADTDISVEFGDDKYVLHPRDRSGCSRLDHFRFGDLIHGYTAKPTAREIGYFTPQIIESFRPDSTFRTNLTVARYSEGESVVIRQRLLVRCVEGQLEKRTIESPDELPTLIEQHFGIPNKLTAEAISRLAL